MDLDEEDVEVIASEVRTCFITTMRGKTGKKYKPADRYDNWNIWNAAAQKCIELNVSPETLVKACFYYAPDVPGGPYPTFLAGKKIAFWVNQFKSICGDNDDDSIEKYLEKEFELAMITFVQVSENYPHKGELEILLDEYLPVKAWVRVLMNMDSCYKDALLAKFGKDAWEYFQENPLFKKQLMSQGYDLKQIKDYAEKTKRYKNGST